MNRAFLIVLLPTVLVAIGYVVVLRSLGLAPGYVRLAVVLAALVAGLWWIGRQSARRNKSKTV